MSASGVIGHSLLNPVQKVVEERRNVNDTASTVSLAVVAVPVALLNMFHVRRAASGVPGANGVAVLRLAQKRTILVSPLVLELVSTDSVHMERRNKLSLVTSKSVWQQPDGQRRQLPPPQQLPPTPQQPQLQQLQPRQLLPRQQRPK